MDPTESNGFSYTYTTSAYSYTHALDETPRNTSTSTEETVPVSVFAHASTMQALARYLVDIRGKSFTDAARQLGRKPKSIWTSYHQTKQLPPQATESNLLIPINIFCGTTPPLESLVLHLKAKGLRNVEIARILNLDPKTTWTAAKRGEERQ